MDKTTKVRVRTMQPAGRFRAGHQFTSEWREVDVTREQLEQLRADPFLAIEGQGAGSEDATELEELRTRVRELEGKLAALQGVGADIPDDQKVHPLGDNLGAPPVAPADTSEKAAEDRAKADEANREGLERQTEAARVARAIPVVDGSARPQRGGRGGREPGGSPTG